MGLVIKILRNPSKWSKIVAILVWLKGSDSHFSALSRTFSAPIRTFSALFPHFFSTFSALVRTFSM